jgi:predicted enzyme related to lactoylglutathione lyase
MRKITLTILIVAVSFFSGFAFKTLITPNTETKKIRKVTGIGGIFFKCKDPKKLREWYSTNLGLSVNQYGCVFEWRQGLDTTQKGFTQWSPFNEKTKYFEKDYMINYRVENMDALLSELRKNGVTICDSVEKADYGKFVHILDLEGTKLELWEPNDVEYDKLGKSMGYETVK